ncbi:MAG: hypothetical protein AAGE01_22410 [Pseudomonadota bacterium]
MSNVNENDRLLPSMGAVQSSASIGAGSGAGSHDNDIDGPLRGDDLVD